MKYILLLFVLLFNNVIILAQGCDSVVVKYDRVQYDPSNPFQNLILTVDTFSNHLLRSTSFGGAPYTTPFGWSYFRYETFTYDSLNRLQQNIDYYLNAQSVYSPGNKIDYKYDSNSRLFSQSTFHWNNSYWLMFPDDYVEHYYRSNGKDSLQISGVDTSGFVPHFRIRFTYNGADSLILKSTDIYNGTSWMPNYYNSYSYAPHGSTNIRTDSLFYFNNTWYWQRIGWTTFDINSDSIHSDNINYPEYNGYVSDYSYSCNHQIESYSGNEHGGSISGYSEATGNTAYDSICRPTSYSNYNRSNNGQDFHEGNYYYIDCNHLILSGLDTVRVCINDTLYPNIFHFGGKAPFHYSWSPATGLSSTNILNPEIFVSADRSYTISVTDSNGIISTHTIFIDAAPLPDIHISIVNIDSLSTCSSAILQAGSSNSYYSYDWYLDGVQKLSYPPNFFQLIATRNGVYSVRTINGNCWNTDTIHVTTLPHSSPAVSITRYCDVLYAISNTGVDFQWYSSGSPIAGQTEDTLHLTGYNDYYVTVKDSVGCSSTSDRLTTQNAYVYIQKYLTCADTCKGILTAQLGYSNAVSFLWSTGETTQSISRLCVGSYSVIITDDNGCTHSDIASISEFVPEIHDLSSSSVPDSSTCNAFAGMSMFNLQQTYSYLWDNGDTQSYTDSLCAGWHYLQTTSVQTGCKQIDSIQTPVHAPNTNCQISMSATQITCPGECNAPIFVSGIGQSPLSYFFVDFYYNGSFVCPGTYHAFLIDRNGCVDFDSILIADPPEGTVTFNITPQALPCSTRVSVNVSNIPAPYNYYWSNNSYDSVDYVCPGVTVLNLYDSDGCTHVFPFLVLEPTCSVSLDTVSPTCHGVCDGSVIAVANGKPPFSYSWNGGDTTSAISNLCVGNYLVTITDSLNCVASNQVQLKGPAMLNAGYKVSYTTCADSCIVLAQPVGGTAPFTYLWCDSTTGAYHYDCINNCMLLITDANGCHSSVLTTIPSVPPLDVSLTKTDATCPGCLDGNIHINHTGGVAPFHISIQPIAGLLNVNTYYSIGAGTYFVCVTDSTGCMECDTIQVGVPPVGINITEHNSFSLAPNPFSSEAIFHFENLSTSKLIVTDVLGKTVRIENMNGELYVFKREDLNAGIYFFSILEKDQLKVNGRLVIVEQ